MSDVSLYEIALAEYERGAGDRALWAKAHFLAEGDYGKQKYEYVRLRVAAMKGERVTNAGRSVLKTANDLSPDIAAALKSLGTTLLVIGACLAVLLLISTVFVSPW